MAVVGHTGSGKSTLASLVPRLMDPTSGRVLLDGVDLRDARSRRTAAANRIRAAGNLSVQRDHRRKHRIRRGERHRGPDPARGRNWPDWRPISSRSPTGYETMVGERGITLSGGQKQRTAIARAILRDPRILILDDALSSVDTLTEERILTGWPDAMRGRTVILISHRVSTVRQADRIVVLEQGASWSRERTRSWSRGADTTRIFRRSRCWKKSWRRFRLVGQASRPVPASQARRRAGLRGPRGQSACPTAFNAGGAFDGRAPPSPCSACRRAPLHAGVMPNFGSFLRVYHRVGGCQTFFLRILVP